MSNKSAQWLNIWAEQRLDLHCGSKYRKSSSSVQSGSVLSVLRLWSQRVAGSKRHPSVGSPVALRGRHTQSVPCTQTLHAQSQPAAGPRQPMIQHPCVGRRSIGESQASVGPVAVMSQGGEHHRLHVPPRRVEGKLRGRAGGFGGRGGQRVQLSSWWHRKRRQRGGGEGVTFSGTHRGDGGGRERPGEERSRPVVFKDLDRQRGDERQQTVGDVSQNQLLVGITTDTNMGGAGLKRWRGGWRGEGRRGWGRYQGRGRREIINTWNF